MAHKKRRKRAYRPNNIKYVKEDFIFTKSNIQNVIDIYKDKKEKKILEKKLFISGEDFLKPQKIKRK